MIDYKKIFEITDDDLSMAYRVLFDEEGEFEEEKKQIIKSFESCCIEASPGSGKTTTLVAKLIILAEKLRKNNCDRGICILTHTNIGIDIIKEKLGSKGDILFKYPNFVGTLQSFIDNYLAIPYFKYKYKQKIEIIDDEYINNYYERIKNIKPLRDFKAIHSKNFLFSKFYYSFKKNGFYNEKRCIIKNENSNNYKVLYERINKGLLKYDEAIQLGALYIEEFPILKKYFSERFFLVQVDEMQDTSDETFEILDKLFDKEKTIVQYIGDKNQNILNGNEKWYTASKKTFIENKSNRFGKNIALFLNQITKNKNISIVGNPQIKDYKPILIFYSLDEYKEIENENKIFNKFIEIIREKNLDKLEGNFKVIGRVGKENEKKITLSSYFNKFSQQNSNKKNSLMNLIRKDKEHLSKNKKIISLLKNKMNYYFKISNVDDYKELIENSKILFHKIIYKYLINKDKKELLNELFKFLEEITSKTLNRTEFNNIFSSFIEDDTEEIMEIDTYSKDDIKLEINTVHSVKGETHLATLYLDTFYKKYDISEYLIENLLSIKKNSEKNKERQNIIFVGASRPKYLLCFACQNILSNLSSQEKEKLKEIFEIVEI